jgi:hypothetical protein
MNRLLLLLALTATVAALGAATAAAATGHSARACRQVTIHDKLAAIATVLSARGMSCRRARTVVRRHGKEAGESAFRKGGRFSLGKFSCEVYFSVEEDNRARCSRPGRSFRVDYGS